MACLIYVLKEYNESRQILTLDVCKNEIKITNTTEELVASEILLPSEKKVVITG